MHNNSLAWWGQIHEIPSSARLPDERDQIVLCICHLNILETCMKNKHKAEVRVLGGKSAVKEWAVQQQHRRKLRDSVRNQNQDSSPPWLFFISRSVGLYCLPQRGCIKYIFTKYIAMVATAWPLLLKQFQIVIEINEDIERGVFFFFFLTDFKKGLKHHCSNSSSAGQWRWVVGVRSRISASHPSETCFTAGLLPQPHLAYYCTREDIDVSFKECYPGNPEIWVLVLQLLVYHAFPQCYLTIVWFDQVSGLNSWALYDSHFGESSLWWNAYASWLDSSPIADSELQFLVVEIASVHFELFAPLIEKKEAFLNCLKKSAWGPSLGNS